MPEPKYIIHTKTNGELNTTTPEHVAEMMAGIREAGKLVIHLHGGLVSESKARAKADELLPLYSDAGAYPVFFVYETGLLKIVRNNFREINNERIFKILLKKLLKYAAGKLTNAGGAKSTGAFPMPNDIEVGIAVNKIPEGVEPFVKLTTTNQEELTDAEEKRFTDDLATDIRFQEELQAIVNGAADFENVESNAKGITVSHQVSKETLMSPEVVQELIEDAGEKGGKGVFSTAKFVIAAGKVLARVISRSIEDRDHGLYTTVVEELLREFYIANVGTAIWGAMKKETHDTFDPTAPEPIRGGWYFVEKLGELMAGDDPPEVSVVAHSLGSVFACNLIDYFAQAREQDDHPLPENFQIKNLIFLAPAVTHERFQESLQSNSELFENFRVFNLSDEIESGYWEVPGVYPRSLLYLVSGLFERNQDGKGAYDKPLVGMQRYESNASVYDGEGVPETRAFLQARPDSIFHSVVDMGPGKATDAKRHGGFDDWLSPAPRKTMQSVAHIVQQS